MSRRILIIVGIGALVLAVVVVLVVAIFGLAVNLTQPVVDAGDQFMKALQNHDMTAAYGLLSPELQAEVSEANFSEIFANAAIDSWSFSSRVIRNDTGRLQGEARIDDKVYSVDLNFINRDGKWLIVAYNFNQ